MGNVIALSGALYSGARLAEHAEMGARFARRRAQSGGRDDGLATARATCEVRDLSANVGF